MDGMDNSGTHQDSTLREWVQETLLLKKMQEEKNKRVQEGDVNVQAAFA